MNSRIIQAVVVSLVLVGGGFAGSDPQAQDVCSRWQVRKLDEAPAWYSEALKKPPTYKETRLSDSLWRTEYTLTSSISVVQYERSSYETSDSSFFSRTVAPGSLYLCDKDTVLLDSNVCGYGILSFGPVSQWWCVTKEWEYIHEDGDRQSIVKFDLTNGQKTILHAHVSSDAPQAAPDGSMVVYSDFADLYVYYPWAESSEVVFKKGGAYARELNCRGRWVLDMKWSADSKSIVFKYYDHYEAGANYELWEVRWMPETDSVADSAR